MLPYPPRSIGEVRRRPRLYPNSSEFCIEITWEFDGYKYRAACAEDSESLPTVEICIKGRWLRAGDTKVAIGRALLQEEQPHQVKVWEEAIMKSTGPLKDIPPLPPDC
jgi:hypothetical protein